jgi:recombination protein RecR
LIESLASLPGIGPKSASRLAFHLLKQDANGLTEFGRRISELRTNLVTCATCHNIASESPCVICRDPGRDKSLLCVVEDALDVVALERSGQFRGRYHLQGGVLSPLEGIGPEQLKLRELEERVSKEGFKEVILALNPTVEGEATAHFVSKRLQQALSTQKNGVSPLKITRLAHGLPTGADLEYADETTLAHALEGRTVSSTQ